MMVLGYVPLFFSKGVISVVRGVIILKHFLLKSNSNIFLRNVSHVAHV